MNALPCSLHSVRVTVQPTFRVPLWNPGQQRNDDIVTFLTPGHGTLSCTSIENDWLVVQHPTEGFLGLPLKGQKNSWEDAWESERVSFEVCTAGGWVEIDSFDQINNVRMRS